MRVIGGQWRGRRIHIPSKNWPVRPTTDFAREALFNILDNRLDYEHISALDLFGGTGMHAIELISRGCEDVTYVDRHKDSVRFVQSFARDENLPVKAIQSDVLKFLASATRQWDYIFADPPYDWNALDAFPETVLSAGVLTENGFFVLEHGSNVHFEKVERFREARHYGQTVFSFFAGGS